jgi:hypothetical protein
MKIQRFILHLGSKRLLIPCHLRRWVTTLFCDSIFQLRRYIKELKAQKRKIYSRKSSFSGHLMTSIEDLRAESRFYAAKRPKGNA